MDKLKSHRDKETGLLGAQVFRPASLVLDTKLNRLGREPRFPVIFA